MTLNAAQNIIANADLTFAGALNLTGGARDANTHNVTATGFSAPTFSAGGYG